MSKVIFITTGTTFSAPIDWAGTADKVEVIGGGGASGNGLDTTSGGGGGAGAYTFQTNVTVANGASLQVGAGGASVHAAGTDTWFVSTGTVFAPGGKGGNPNSTGGVGGLAANCVPSANAFSGGTGGSATNSTGGGGGGGAAGPNGAGATGGVGANVGVAGQVGAGGGGGGGGGTAGAYAAFNQTTSTGGSGGNNHSGSGGGAGGTNGVNGTAGSAGGGGGGGGGAVTGTPPTGAGGAGGRGTEWDALHGSGGGGGGAGRDGLGIFPSSGTGGLYGGGGGGPNDLDHTTFGAGAQGIIVVTYTPLPGVFDILENAVSEDIVTYNSNWTYAIGSTGQITVGTTGAQFASGGLPGGLAYWNGQSFTADQTSKVTLASFVTGAFAGPAVRVSAGQGYAAWFDAGHYNLVKFIASTATSLIGGPQPLTTNPGDIAILQVVGNTLTLTVGNSTIKTITDSSITTGSPGIAFNGTHPSTVLNTWNGVALGINVSAQSVTSVIGQISDVVGAPLTHQTSSFTEGTLTRATSINLGSQTATFVEGALVNVIPIGSQTATFAEGALTFSITSGAAFSFPSMSIGAAQGIFADGISYVLDQGATVANLFGQTSTFTEGAFGSIVIIDALGSQSITFTEGVIGGEVDLLAPAQTVTSTEGQISSTLGNNFTSSLMGQSSAFSSGVIGAEADYALTASTLTSTEGTITFSAAGDFTATLAGQLGLFVSGSMLPNVVLIPRSGYPDMTGLLLEDATARLEVAGAVVPASIGYFGTWPITVNWVPSQTVAPFVVISQSVTPFTPIVANAPIALTVSQPNESVAYP